MARRLSNGVIEAICKYTEDTEVPAIFSIWAGVSTVSAILGRDCFVDQGFFVIYPNVYIILVAGSARCRKSTAVNIARDFIGQVEPSVNALSQKMTPESLIGTLSGMMGDTGSQQIVPSAVGVAISDELSTLIDRNSFKSGLIALLTNLYDCSDFEYSTRGRGKELVKNPCLSMLGASTIQWIKESIPEIAIGGGFTSRIIFVYKDKREKLVYWPTMSDELKLLREDIIHDLNEIAKMRGPMVLHDAAREIYKDEYERFYLHSPLMDNLGLSGYANRRHHILLKVAISVSAASSDERIITEKHMIIALSLLKKAEEAMPLVLRAMVSEKVGDIFEEILAFILAKKTITKPLLIRQFRHKMTAAELDIYMRTLEEEGIVKIEYDGKTIRYTYVNKA